MRKRSSSSVALKMATFFFTKFFDSKQFEFKKTFEKRFPRSKVSRPSNSWLIDYKYFQLFFHKIKVLVFIFYPVFAKTNFIQNILLPTFENKKRNVICLPRSIFSIFIVKISVFWFVQVKHFYSFSFSFFFSFFLFPHSQ